MPDPVPDLPCPNCDHPAVFGDGDKIWCRHCGLTMYVNDEAKYGPTVDRWKALIKVRPEAEAGRRGRRRPHLSPQPRSTSMLSWLLNKLAGKPTVEVKAIPESGDVMIGFVFRGVGLHTMGSADDAEEIASNIMVCANEARGFPRE